MRVPTSLITLSLAAGLLAACTHNPIDPQAPADARAALTSQGAWRLLQATHADGSRIEALNMAGRPLRLQFVDNRVSVYGGCNQLTATFAVRGHTLAVDDMASTRMACEAPLMQADSEIGRLLAKPLDMRWSAGNERLSLFAADGSRLLLEAIPLE